MKIIIKTYKNSKYPQKINKKPHKFAIFYYFLIIFIIILTFYILLTFNIFIVKGNSQYPYIKDGDTILVKSENSYQPGDIVSFNYNYSMIVTHRLLAIIETDNESYYIFHGDNNDNIDKDKEEKEDWTAYAGYLNKLISSNYSINQILETCHDVEIAKFHDIIGKVVLVF